MIGWLAEEVRKTCGEAESAQTTRGRSLSGARDDATMHQPDWPRLRRWISMKQVLASLLIAMTSAVAAVAAAVTDGDFEVKTAQNLRDLCTVAPDDPRYKEALHFCHGYLVGAYHYYLATLAGPNAKPLVCPPDPPPSRDAVISGFIAWARTHPQYMNEAPVETEFRYLIETWPCKR